jgi:hypothetical protein
MAWVNNPDTDVATGNVVFADFKRIMKQNKFGELVFNQTDVIDLIMQGQDLTVLDGMIVDDSVDLHHWPEFLSSVPKLQPQQSRTCSVEEFHTQQQQNWHMPESYKHMDIAAYVLGLCDSRGRIATLWSRIVAVSRTWSV